MPPNGDSDTAAASAGNRFFSSLAYDGYRRLFFSTSAAGLANWTLVVGRGWLAFHLTGSSAWVGVITFAGFLPFALGPIGGVLADRYERQRLAAISTAVGCLLSVLLAALTLADLVDAWQLALITLAMSAPRAAELPARQALIAGVVPERELLNAVSLSSVANFGTRALGPALVVPLIDGLGIGGLFFVAAGFYGVATVLALSIRTRGAAAGRSGAGPFQNLAEGLLYIFRTPSVAALMFLVMFHCGLTMSFDSLLPVFAVQELHAGGASFSALAMGVGAGALVGTLFIAGIRSERSQGKLILVTAVLSGVTPMAMALPMSVMSLPVAVSTTLAMGASQGAFMAMAGALIQVAAPDRLRGRVSSIYLLFAGGLMAWVNLINGALADIWDVPLLFLLPAALYLVILALMTAGREPLRFLFRSGRLEAVAPAQAAGVL
jgi:MFS family permease